ncbi:FAD-binding protein [Daejeonella oryzae]|uniref:FAD-binding protein n=1 Tax=Daejeonella oryzae TaxID=1122943 RepID=UPI00042971BA|nr:FAD-binding protein [Daejeonella oryzae]
MAHTSIHPIGTWDTFHNNGPFPTKTLYKTTLEEKGNMPSDIERYNDASVEIRRLLKDALDHGEGFRAYGSAWSMSHIAHHKDRMHYNGEMNIKIPVSAEMLEQNTSFKNQNLYLFECGNTIKEISEFVFRRGQSLKASGASNGQTIGGSISTGIHGSALDFGSVQDFVVGINLITGPAESDIVYLERHTQPALNKTFTDSIGARVIRNDGLFNAALVGLGAFGFVHSVLIETEDRFLLNRYVRKISKEEAIQLAETLNFKDSNFRISTEVDAEGKGNRPFHYKVFINPYNNDSDYVVEVMYKKPYREVYEDPFPRIKTALYKDLIILFGKIAERYKNSIPKLIKLLEKDVLPKPDDDVTGTLAEIFWDAPHQGPAFACSVGIDHRDSGKALQLLVKLAREEGPIPGIYAMRFVKASKATLAFTRFPVTCMLEIDGVLWKGNKNMLSLEQFSERMIDVLKSNNIPFTLHWGKNAAWSYPGLIQHMYGTDAVKWKEYRSALLSRQTASLFSNTFLEDIQLSEYVADTPPGLIDSIENIPV